MSAFAWKCTGHMLVALIAELNLISQDPKAYSEASLITSYLNSDLSSSLSQTFIESACWPDDLKRQNITDYNEFHYFDKPFYPINEFNVSLPSTNLLSAWTSSKLFLQRNSFDLFPSESSFNLRFLLHLTGDVHQPMHCVSLFSELFPEGDLGGTLFEVEYNGNTQLHLFWDTGAGMWQDELVRPLSGDDRRKLVDIALNIMKEWPYSYVKEHAGQDHIEKWCDESYEIAVGFAYNGLELHDKLSDEYLEAAQKIVRKRIAYAGYRLTSIISALF